MRGGVKGTKEPLVIEKLRLLAEDFNEDILKEFLLLKNRKFQLLDEYIPLHDEELEEFKETRRIAKVDLDDNRRLSVYTIKVNKELKERSSKRRQFKLAKKLLKDEYYFSDAGFFIFYDSEGNFRFSLVFGIPKGTKREFSYYKRYTYFIEKGKPYRTFLKQLGEANFNTLEGIIEAFSLQPLTREFYEEIERWYAWALERSDVWFPGGSKEENLIRLLTRLIFVWFLKEKDLVPSVIFDESELPNIVKDFMKKDYYYNAILQNLFFATLNKLPKDRGWAFDEGFIKNRSNFGVKMLFRYEKFLKIPPEEFLDLFKDVPFINGGLFECLDRDSNYVDGFSRNEDKRAKIPDELFFSDKQKILLKSFYESEKSVEVRGLINILKDYSWTADENSPIDVDVSLDPELLGHIFENLLASYNPETRTTARKSTGSYYTPKEIVDFMVEESIIEYLKDKTGIQEERLRELLSYSEEVESFSEKERRKIIEAIDQLKVIDPAVGSGAFPMGVLHKLVHILNKIDPDNSLWLDTQLSKAIKEIEEIEELGDEEKKARIGEIEANFDEKVNYPDYARKLYIIENSIYGVDIQNIAVQISKLRFFLTLLIDQKVSRDKENWGIKPLPHLETKFVCANTLVGLNTSNIRLIFSDYKLRSIKEKLAELRRRHFKVKNRTELKRLRERYDKLRRKLGEELRKLKFPDTTVEKIVGYDILDQTACANWFDPEWMFGVKGFDIVIGNPPYVRQERIKELKPILKAQGYKTFVSTADLYVYFYEKGYNLLKRDGILCFISSNKWMRAKYGEKLRKFLQENTEILKLIDFSGYRVFAQTVDTCIVIFRKKEIMRGENKLHFAVVSSEVREPIEYVRNHYHSLPQNKLSVQAWILADEKVLKLKEKIEKIGVPLKDWDVRIYRGVLTGFNKAFIIDTETRNRILANCKTEEERRRTEKIIKPVLRGRDIKRYCYKWAGLWLIGTFPALKLDINNYPALKSYLKSFGDRLLQDGKKGHRKKTNNKWFETQDNIAYYPEFEKEKIVWQEIVREPQFFLDKKKFFIEATAFIMLGENIRYLCGLLNSKPVAKFFKLFYAGGGLGEKGYRYKKAIP